MNKFEQVHVWSHTDRYDWKHYLSVPNSKRYMKRVHKRQMVRNTKKRLLVMKSFLRYLFFLFINSHFCGITVNQN